MRQCRYRACRRAFVPAKPHYWFCCFEHRQLHGAENDYRGYRRSGDQSYDRGWNDAYRSKPPGQPAMPPGIWKVLAVLVHPDRGDRAPDGIKQLSHEAMIWLLDHRPSEVERS